MARTHGMVSTAGAVIAAFALVEVVFVLAMIAVGIDGYCATCKRRNQECRCAPPERLWEPCPRTRALDERKNDLSNDRIKNLRDVFNNGADIEPEHFWYVVRLLDEVERTRKESGRE